MKNHSNGTASELREIRDLLRMSALQTAENSKQIRQLTVAQKKTDAVLKQLAEAQKKTAQAQKKTDAAQRKTDTALRNLIKHLMV